jgi:putative nucleotidyltransferase with HDIG domain/PAS domain S-box-containing protein
VLLALIKDPNLLTHFQTYKGLAFVLTSAVLIAALIHSELRQRNRVEKRLRDDEAQLRVITEQIPAVVWTTDTELRFTSSTGAGLVALKLGPNQVVGRSLFEYFQTENPEIEPIAAHRCALEGDPVSYELQWDNRIYQSHVEPLRDSNGQIVGVIGIALDITPLKRAQERETQLRLQLECSAIQTATMLARVIDERDPYTFGHCQRLAEYAVRLGKRLGLPEGRLEQLRHAALLHDIGKVGVPEAILKKPGKLTKEERAQMEKHVLIGAQLIASIPTLERASLIIAQHHEHWDGSGYPNGLQGEKILLEARILSVVDAYDAMTTERPYRRTLSPREASAELLLHAGGQWDPLVVEALVEEMSGTKPGQGSAMMDLGSELS